MLIERTTSDKYRREVLYDFCLCAYPVIRVTVHGDRESHISTHNSFAIPWACTRVTTVDHQRTPGRNYCSGTVTSARRTASYIRGNENTSFGITNIGMYSGNTRCTREPEGSEPGMPDGYRQIATTLSQSLLARFESALAAFPRPSTNARAAFTV